MEELKTAVAFLFKRKGAKQLDESDFLYSASMDLRWFTPKEAQKLLELALHLKYVERDGDKVQPTFDPDELEFDLDFKPTKEALEINVEAKEHAEEEVNLMERLVEMISCKGGMEKQKVVAEVNRKQERMMVDVEVAALMVAHQMGLKINDYIDEVGKVVRSRF